MPHTFDRHYRFPLFAAIVVCGLAGPLWAAEEPATLATYKNWVTGLAFSPNGAALASVGGQSLLYRPGDVLLWDVAGGKQRASLAGHETSVWSVAFSPDGQTLASGGYDGTVKLWNVAMAKEQASLAAHKNWIQ